MTGERKINIDQFPLSAKYNPEWIVASASSGANSLWLTEWLTTKMDLRPGMRILDLGCGRAVSSIFLRREFGVQVWATDLWFNASENYQRIRDAGVEDGVFPIHADAHALPFAAEFFDAVLCIDAYPYFGTDDLYLANLARFIKPGAQLGIAGAGLMQEIDDSIPAHLHDWWSPDNSCLHTVDWWQRHWQRTGIVDIEIADTMDNGWHYWLDWLAAIDTGNTPEISALESDAGRYLGYTRLVARRRQDVELEEPLLHVSTEYNRKPMLYEENK